MKVAAAPILTKPQLQFRLRWLAHAAVVLACIAGIFFAHEFSHALTAIALGGRIISMNILGVQWIPTFALAPEFGFGGYTTWLIPFNSLSTRLIVAAGSTGTLLIALVAVLVLNLVRVRGMVFTALVVLSLYFIDSIIHLYPVLGRPSNVAPPWVRSFSETYYALLDLGFRSDLYIASVLLLSALILLLLIRGIRRSFLES